MHIYIFLIMLLLGLETGFCAKKNSDLLKCKSQRYDDKTLFLLMWPPVILMLILLMLQHCEKGVACLAFSVFL